jgi:hypothetical protein
MRSTTYLVIEGPYAGCKVERPRPIRHARAWYRIHDGGWAGHWITLEAHQVREVRTRTEREIA